MTLDQLIANPPTGVNGQFVDVDKEFGPQCWDLVELYAEQVLNIPKAPWAITLGPNQAAYEAWTVFDVHMQQYFTKIPVGQQQRGDINIYTIHPGGLEGHINIQIDNGQVFEQNADPDGSASHIYTRPTTFLLGSLRLKGEEQSMLDQTLVDSLYIAYWGREPNQTELEGWVGQPTNNLIKALDNTPQHTEFFNAAKGIPTVTVGDVVYVPKEG